MVIHMKTTLNIDESVMKLLRQEAARQGRTMSELVEAGLRRILDPPVAEQSGEPTPLPSWHSGGSLVDVADREALHEALHESPDGS